MIPVARVVGVALNAAVDKTASVDRLAPGEIHRPVVLSAVPGGKAANVVRAAAHLGLPGSVVAVLAGHAGSWYRSALQDQSIPLFAVEVAGETRTCLSVLDESTGALTEFYEPGLTLCAPEWRRVESALRDALALDGPGTVVVLAGSLPPGAPPDAYARLSSIAAEAGARAVVDIDGEPLVAALSGRPWLVKVNAAEAETITGSSARTGVRAMAAAQELRRRGAAMAIVTRGVHGAALATDEGTWTLGNLEPRHRGPFSVGSGDAFLAGFLAGLARGLPPAAALSLAGAAGAANARHAGQGELDPADVERIAPSLEVAAGGPSP
jgi:tagatose 6-phosphate kinase